MSKRNVSSRYRSFVDARYSNFDLIFQTFIKEHSSLTFVDNCVSVLRIDSFSLTVEVLKSTAMINFRRLHELPQSSDTVI